MRALVFVLVLGLLAVVVPPAAEAHSQLCHDLRCMIGCTLDHALLPGEHECIYDPGLMP